MKFFVTGVNGQLGHDVMNELEKRGYEAKDRKTNIDLLRIFSAVAVIIIHTNALFYYHGDKSLLGVITEILNYITRFSVPCFVMISGAFALKVETTDSFIEYYKKRVIQVAVPYLLIAGFWTAYYTIAPVEEETILKRFSRALCGEYGNLWFMPTIILLYLITPYIRMIKKNATDRQWKLGTIGLMIWAIESATPVGKAYSIGVVGSFLAYYLMGDVISSSKIKSEMRNRVSTACLAGTAIVSVITVYFRCMMEGMVSLMPFDAFFTHGVVVLSLLVFTFFQTIHIPKRNIISKFGSVSLYVYLIHTPIYRILYKVLEKLDIGGVPEFAVLTMGTIIASFVLALVWGKIHNAVFKKELK